LKTAKDSGASIIAVEAGVLALRGRNETYIKHDQFVVKKTFAVSQELREIREKTLSDEGHMPKGRCTVAAAHRKLCGASTHLGKSKCSCKGGKCSSLCGCRRKKRPCNSMCSCHADRPNTKDSPVAGHRVFEAHEVSVYTPLAPKSYEARWMGISSRRTSTKDLESPQ